MEKLMRIELIELDNGFLIFREGFNGCNRINIWCGTIDHAMQIMAMILEKENAFNE